LQLLILRKIEEKKVFPFRLQLCPRLPSKFVKMLMCPKQFFFYKDEIWVTKKAQNLMPISNPAEKEKTSEKSYQQKRDRKL
jgi:hypothetical protein